MIFVVIDPDRIVSANIKDLIDKLSGDGAANFLYIGRELKKIDLSDELKAEFAQLVAAKIIFTIKCGAWRDLDGAKELAEFLNLGRIKLTAKWAQLVGEYYLNFSYGFLTSLCPYLVNNDYWDEEENGYRRYDKMEYARKKIRALGKIPEDKLTDGYIQCLGNVRELLILMHLNHVVLSGQPSIENILAIAEPARRITCE